MAETTLRLLGPDGQPVRKQDLTREIAAPSLAGVRQIISGHPSQGLTPARLGQLLRSAEQGDPTAYLELAEDMEEKDLHYAGVLGVRKRAVRGMELRVEPVGESGPEQEAAELVREVLTGDGVADDLVDIMDAVGKGYSVTEIVWRERTGAPGERWTIERLEWRDPRWFRPSREDGRTMFLLGDGGQEEPLKPWKFVTHFARAKSGLPVRSGLARLAAWAYIFKNFALKDWAIFLEAYGHPMRLGKYGPEATAEDRTTLLRALRSIGVDMAAAVPRSMEVEFIQAQGVSGNVEYYEKSARYWDEQVSKGVLGQVATTDAIAGGHAVGKVHNDVREDIRDADASQLAVTLRRDLATPLTALNFGAGVGVPRVRFEAPDEVPLTELVSGVSTLVPLGLRVRTSDVYTRLGLSAPEDGDELLRPAAVPAAPASPAAPGPQGRVAARAEPAPAADSIDDVVEALIAEGHAETAAAPMMAPIGRALIEATSLEALRVQLRELADRAPPAELVALLGRAGFAAALSGIAGAPVNDAEAGG